MNARDYLNAVKLALATNDLISDVQVIREYAVADAGFIRARLQLRNHDFLFLAEYFIIVNETIEVVQYRYQWMDADRKKLRKRWDNARHYPHLDNFPHHVHIGDDNRVEPGNQMSIAKLFQIIEEALDASP